jgi:NAD(P)-dependent dehydrogenase (short-subunit alcohol dehydrogenase family)
MDAAGIDRPTALVCGQRPELLREVARSLAAQGYDVHLPRELVDSLDPADPLARRLHPADDAEAALVAAVGGRARPLEVAVLDRADPALQDAVATFMRATGRGQLLRAPQPRRRGAVARALDALRATAGRRRTPVVINVTVSGTDDLVRRPGGRA